MTNAIIFRNIYLAVDQPPQFKNCPLSEDLVFQTATGTTQAEVSWNAPDISDDNMEDEDRENVEVTIERDPPLDPPLVLEPLEDQTLTLDKGVYTVVYTYTDVNLQDAECPFTVTVEGRYIPCILGVETHN